MRADAFIRANRRPCSYVTSRRLTMQPLRRSGLDQLLGQSSAPPSLATTASKFGGMPFSQMNISKSSLFVGQVNFATLPLPIPNAPNEGILELYVDVAEPGGAPTGFRLRWHATAADLESSAWRAAPQSYGNYEAEMVMKSGFTLPVGEAWKAAIAFYGDDELNSEWMKFAPAGYNDDQFRGDCHRIFGHRAAGLKHATGFAGEQGLGDRAQNYEMIMRLTQDREADFSWGGKHVYIMIDPDDLARSRMERAVVVGSTQ
ncbi:MAG: DUF1963 domain-containing protein [Sandaracinaceae bacterium]|nr:DUF1963 domain-containing protein [Sandaracinaceae bacterium]